MNKFILIMKTIHFHLFLVVSVRDSPNWMRLGPHSIIGFLMSDNICIAFGLKPI